MCVSAREKVAKIARGLALLIHFTFSLARPSGLDYFLLVVANSSWNQEAQSDTNGKRVVRLLIHLLGRQESEAASAKINLHKIISLDSS